MAIIILEALFCIHLLDEISWATVSAITHLMDYRGNVGRSRQEMDECSWHHSVSVLWHCGVGEQVHLLNCRNTLIHLLQPPADTNSDIWRGLCQLILGPAVAGSPVRAELTQRQVVKVELLAVIRSSNIGLRKCYCLKWSSNNWNIMSANFLSFELILLHG